MNHELISSWAGIESQPGDLDEPPERQDTVSPLT
jgi:hypothetical protein